jgi:hypothetical protein
LFAVDHLLANTEPDSGSDAKPDARPHICAVAEPYACTYRGAHSISDPQPHTQTIISISNTGAKPGANSATLAQPHTRTKSQADTFSEPSSDAVSINAVAIARANAPSHYARSITKPDTKPNNFTHTKPHTKPHSKPHTLPDTFAHTGPDWT